MLASILLAHIWVALLLWLAIYASDYALTIYQIGLYRKGVREHVVFEGSLELNPFFQKDVERQRKFSLRWMLMAVLTSLILFACWWLSVVAVYLPAFFWFALGSLLLLEAAVHVRHLTNIVQFHQVLSGGAAGRIAYSRKLSLSASAGQFAGFALLFLACFFLTERFFFLGGAASCAVTALKHWTTAGKQPPGPNREPAAK
jgi:hypothetical protein